MVYIDPSNSTQLHTYLLYLWARERLVFAKSVCSCVFCGYACTKQNCLECICTVYFQDLKTDPMKTRVVSWWSIIRLKLALNPKRQRKSKFLPLTAKQLYSVWQKLWIWDRNLAFSKLCGWSLFNMLNARIRNCLQKLNRLKQDILTEECHFVFNWNPVFKYNIT